MTVPSVLVENRSERPSLKSSQSSNQTSSSMLYVHSQNDSISFRGSAREVVEERKATRVNTYLSFVTVDQEWMVPSIE